jgi:hypothetical protein
MNPRLVGGTVLAVALIVVWGFEDEGRVWEIAFIASFYLVPLAAGLAFGLLGAAAFIVVAPVALFAGNAVAPGAYEVDHGKLLVLGALLALAAGVGRLLWHKRGNPPAASGPGTHRAA